MNEIKKVLICGIGAVGSIYADKIQNYDFANLRILVDENRLKKYTQNPIVFNGKTLDFKYVLPNENNFKADLIIIATKFDGLQQAVKNIKNFIKEDSIILSLLNGVTSEEIISKTYGRDKLLYSFFIGHSAVRVGNNVTHDDINTIVFGSENKNDFVNMQKVKLYFEKVGINYEIPQDIKRSLWLKFMLNVCANQSTAILRMTFGEMLENNEFMNFAEEIMKEVQVVAKAEGVNNTETMIEETVKNLNKMLPEGKTSMLQDIEAGRKTEVEMFAGTVIELGLKHGFATPYNTVLKKLIDIIGENQRLKSVKKCQIAS